MKEIVEASSSVEPGNIWLTGEMGVPLIKMGGSEQSVGLEGPVLIPGLKIITVPCS